MSSFVMKDPDWYKNRILYNDKYEKRGDGTTRRVYASEREELVRLFALRTVSNALPEEMATRAKMIPGLTEELETIKRMVDEALFHLLETVPKEQEEQLVRTLLTTSYLVGARRPAAQDNNADYGLWISNHTMNALLDAIQQSCIVCFKEEDEERRCPLRKALDMIGTDVEHGDRGECGYRTI